ncbi:hypothetical protein BJV82DRAFT_586797 [Fennellomyces sp. T-0311]|nr:hypothetical protein BJV82DRAFT_586797 [Fennellomyces sp. T-0311]
MPRQNRASNGDPFVSKLPYDIIELIWANLTLRERIRCTRVCTIWRSLLLNSNVLWSEIADCNIRRDLIRYEINGKQVRRVDLESQNTYAIHFLIRLACTNIHTITNAHYFDNPSYFFGKHIQDLLNITGHALRTLDITVVDRTPKDFFITLFTTCTNLTHMRCIFTKTGHYHLPGPHPTGKDTVSPTIAQSMKRVVDLSVSVLDVDIEELKQVLLCFTGLKHFYMIRPPTVDEFSRWLDESLPSLQTIRLGDAYECPPVMFSQAGRKVLAVIDKGNGKTAIIAHKHRDIMNAFHLKANFDSGPIYEMFQHFTDLGMPYLRSLALESYRPCTPPFGIQQVINQLPCLEQLIIRYINFTAVPTDTDTLSFNTNLSLKTIKLNYCGGVTTADLRRIVARFSPFMKCISFIGLNELPDEILRIIYARVLVLGRLELSHGDLTSYTVRELVDSWTGRKLNVLEIGGPNKIKSPLGLTRYAREKLANTTVNLFT